MAKNKTNYVDGFVFVVPKKNVVAYQKMAKAINKFWIQCGALDYKECMCDDLNATMGGHPMLSFGQIVKLKKGETVWFSYVTYKSRAHRDQVNKKVAKAMEEQSDAFKNMPMPFDPKRMAYGGFKVMVSA